MPEELDLVEEEDQFTHMITLDDATTGRSSIFDRCLDSNPESSAAIMTVRSPII